MNNNIEVQGFKVLTELTHNKNGNPHSQYVGNNKDTMLKPSYDLLNAQNGVNLYWKIAEYEINKADERYITLCFDLFDEYQGLFIGKSSYEVNIYPNGEGKNSTRYYPNGIVKNVYGSDYDRFYIVENKINEDLYKCEIFIKNKSQWNFPKIAVRYLNTNNRTFKLINNERMIATLPSGDIFTSIPHTYSLMSNKSTIGNTYVKLAEFNINYTTFSKTFVLDISKCVTTSNSQPYYATILIQFYNDATSVDAWVSTNYYYINNVNFKNDDLFIVRDSNDKKKVYLYGKFDKSDQYFTVSLNNMFDYSNSVNREITIKRFDIETVEPTPKSYFKVTDSIKIFDNVNKITNELYIDNWKLKVKNSKEEIVGVVPSPQTVPKSNATDITQMVADFNALIDKLKTAGIVNS